MLPITIQPEPDNFDSIVRTPGNAFLRQVPHPTTTQWSKNAFWQAILPEMRIAYQKVCSYSCCWIPRATGSHSIDHFIPKNTSPLNAFEWSNYRYVSSRFNSRKGLRVIVDPFSMAFEWFRIDFATIFIKPRTELLDPQQITLAENTITWLQLNIDDELVNERYEFYKDYRNGHISFEYLKEKLRLLLTNSNGKI